MNNVRISLLILFLLIHFSVKAQNKDSKAVMKSVNDFVTAFNHFNWDTFRGSFTDDATIFYPYWSQAKRIHGRQEIEKAWLTIFPEFIDINNSRKLQISPKDIHLQLYQQNAIVTFHLGDGLNSLSRRTLLMIKEKGSWKIAHLHASSVTKDPVVSKDTSKLNIDVLKASPANFKLLLENEHVRVLEYTLKPGEKDTAHTHPAKSSYIVTGGKIKVHFENGETISVDEVAGTASWMGYTGKHYVENIGNTTIKIVITEVKSVR
ncbi:nuclear transport factor 2 family protein [Lacibacter sp. H375]|uniref:nuclear transport factor 2 family protein n=1 Tax=Lacibacter sp. H375 TaxID=3133424 RepID=UPI0030BD6479